MKHKYFVMTLCASALLTACSSGGGSNNQPSQPQKNQGQSQNVPAPKAPDNLGQQQNIPAPNTPDNSGQQQNSPAPNAPDNSGQKQNNPAPNTPDNSGQPQNSPAPNTPDNSGQPQNNSTPNMPNNSEQQQNNPTPKVPDNAGDKAKPDTMPPQSNPVTKYTGEYVNKYLNGATWNGDKDVIIVYEITPTKEFEDGISGAKAYASKEVRLTLAEAQTNSKNYKFLPLDEVGYYGYRQALEPDAKGLYNDYVYAVNEKLIAKDVPTDLNATYHREKGFIFGPASAQASLDNRIHRISDVNIVFNNGEALGSVTTNGETQFKITGNTKSLIFENSNVDFLKQVDKATMTPKFINSSENAKDLRYITGIVKGENWAGVLAAEKK